MDVIVSLASERKQSTETRLPLVDRYYNINAVASASLLFFLDIYKASYDYKHASHTYAWSKLFATTLLVLIPKISRLRVCAFFLLLLGDVPQILLLNLFSEQTV